MITLDLDVTRFRANRGIMGQWRINRELARLLFVANARSRGDFDRLPRRYRAVAADLQTGDPVVLARGDIARAVRASMAVPGFFAPVEWDGRVLVDGGIADNLPTSLARQLGATRVIASDVSSPPAEIYSYAPLAVVSRALDLMEKNMQRDTVAADVLILPQLEPSLSGARFPHDPSPLLDAGLAAALAAFDTVPQPFMPSAPIPSTSTNHLAAPDTTVTEAAAPIPLFFAAIAIEAPDTALALLARRAFADAAPGPFDADAVNRAMDVLYGTGLFEGVWPSVTETDAAGAVLALRVEGPPPLSLAAAAGYDNDRGGRAWASLDRYVGLSGRPSVLTLAGSVDDLERWGAVSARMYSLDHPGIEWSIGAHAEERAVRSFDEDVVGTAEVVRTGGWLALERPQILREKSAILRVRTEWVSTEGGAEGLSAGPLLRYGDIETDMRVVGVPLLLEGERRWGGIQYSRAAFAGSYTVERGALQVAPLLDARLTTRDAPLDVRRALGDNHIIPGLRWGEQRGTARLVAGVDGAYRVAYGFVRARVRSGTATDDAALWHKARWVTGADIGLVLQSPIGVVELAYGRATRGDGRFDVNIGRTF
jgi:hypothetical protein